jgi:hypothetical protein
LTLIAPVEKCVLLQKWAESRVLVFFDLGEIEDKGDMYRFGAPVLWASDPRCPNGTAVLWPVYRRIFIEAVIKGEPLNGKFSKVLQCRARSRSRF